MNQVNGSILEGGVELGRCSGMEDVEDWKNFGEMGVFQHLSVGLKWWKLGWIGIEVLTEMYIRWSMDIAKKW
jgi:hypothetical protein